MGWSFDGDDDVFWLAGALQGGDDDDNKADDDDDGDQCWLVS